jgi:CheY-like chemotaxis protein
MSGSIPEWLGAGGLVAHDRIQPHAGVLGSRPGGDTVKCIPACYRLLRVLIVDDDRDTADSLAMLVKIWGHDARLAYDGAAALETASAYQPDVLLLDIAMPTLDGFKLARQLRRQIRFKDTLVVAVTGYADQGHRLLGAEGFDHYLVKPVEPSTLEGLLQMEHDRLADALGTSGVAARKCGLLVVDDEGGVRGLLDVGMRQEGFAVWLAADGQEALDLYRRRRGAIDVVLMDVRMPGLDGPQTLAALQGIDPQVRCCFMSGDPGSYTEQGLCELGADAVLRKPFRLAEVARVLRETASRADRSMADQ